MNSKPFIVISIGIFLVTFLYSCGCSCHCQRNLGCGILTVTQNTNDSVLLTKIYCSQTNFYSDSILQDSLKQFFSMHQTDSTTVTRRDSIYKYETSKDVDCPESDELVKEGFGCECAK